MKSTFSLIAILAISLQVFPPSAHTHPKINTTRLLQHLHRKVKHPTQQPTILQTTTGTTEVTISATTTLPSIIRNDTELAKVLLNSTETANLEDNEGRIPSNSSITNTTSLLDCKPESTGKSSKSYLTDETIRFKLCSNIPRANLSKEYRFDLDAKQCSSVGMQGHCGKNMKFYSFPGSKVYGHCDCDHTTRTPLIYHEKTDRCYFMYQQGFCKPDEWIELQRENFTVTCTTNRCYDVGRTNFTDPPLASRDTAPEYAPLNGIGPCVKLNQPSGYCKDKKNNFVAFRWPSHFYPNCGEIPPPPSRYMGEVASLECSPGSYLSSTGDCQPTWEFS